MNKTEHETWERICKTGIMTVINPVYEGMTPEEVLENARVKDIKTLLIDRRRKI